MSTPRAIKPLFGIGSRLIVDQFLLRSAGKAPVKLFSSLRTGPIQPPISICWSCRHSYVVERRQQLRFSSTSKPPNGPKINIPDLQNEPHTPPPLPSFSPSTSPSTPPDPLTQEASSSSPPSEQEKDTSPPPPPPPPLAPDADLPSAQNSRRSALNQSLSAFMDRAQTTLFAASQRINHLTGYSSIESLKDAISALEAQLGAAQSHLTRARAAYKSAVSDRAATQREVTTLLARQKTWTPADFERFTTLYRQDYELEASVGERAAELEHAEREAERLGRELGAGILARYHEEQIWSDKIRRMSTWGTWGLMGVNILLFLLLQFGAEPWRRRRLVRGFEEKVREALAEERAAREKFERAATTTTPTAAAAAATSVAAVPQGDGDTEAVGSGEGEPVVMVAPDVAVPESDVLSPPSPIPETAPIDDTNDDNSPRIIWREFLTDPNRWRTALVDLLSDRKIALRMRDVSIIALEGVVAGAAVAGTIAVYFVRKNS
ncbi:hypothetical protein F5Y19DRAFT_484848 [Xylariaceae sp. FL1651]|nr:hypothetical protein F5Y19DRAFT_484848 [Xylariaceae sp. FL1651]